MRIDHHQLIFWYSLLQAVSIAACLHSFGYLLAALFGMIIYFFVTAITITMTNRPDARSETFKKFSEHVGLVGTVSFVLLIAYSSILSALMVFIVFALVALNFQTHEYRKLYLGMVVCFVLLCAGAVESKAGSFLIWLVMFGISLSFCLGSAYVAQLEKASNHIACRARDYWPACVYLLSLTLIIYLVLPRFPAGNIGGYPGSDHFYKNEAWEKEAEENNSNSFEDQLKDLQSEQHRMEDIKGSKIDDSAHDDETDETNSDIVKSTLSDDNGRFHYKGFDDELDVNETNDSLSDEGSVPPNLLVAYLRSDQPLYLRLQTFDFFDGVRWKKTNLSSVKKTIPFGGLDLNAIQQGAKILGYDFEAVVQIGNQIPLSAVPTHLNFPSIAVSMDAYGQLKAPGSILPGTSYSAKSAIYIKGNRVYAEQKSPSNKDIFLQRPNSMDNRIALLASEVSEAFMSVEGKSVALEQYLRLNYSYSVESLFNSQGRTPLAGFLFDKKEGHCEYFASALAIMLRTIGIPSRLVTGFSATSQNPLTGYFEIYAYDAHAWVEAYIEGKGWLVLEPTPIYNGPFPEKVKLSAEKIDRYVERLNDMQHLMKGNTDFSFEALWRTLWNAVKTALVLAISLIKAFLIDYKVLVLTLIITIMLALFLMPTIMRHYKIKQIITTAKQAQHLDQDKRLDIYMECIEDLLRQKVNLRSEPLTIERWLERFANLNLPIEQMAHGFNLFKYARKDQVNALGDYELLFNHLSKLKSNEVSALISVSALTKLKNG